MKRVAKSGHQKRVESKRKALEQSAFAPGQRSLLQMLESTSANVNSTGCTAVNEPNDTYEEMPCEIQEDSCHKLQHPVPVMVLVDTDTEIKETTTTLEQNCQIETASTAKSVLEENEDSVDWYKGMKLDINWLLKIA